MMRISSKYKPWIFLLSLWLALEPLVVPILQAEEMPKPTIDSKKLNAGDNGLSNIKDVMTPSEYLEYMLELRQATTKKDMETKVWGDWMSTISGAYMLMDAGSQDVFTFYSAMKAVKGLPETAKGITDFLKVAAKKTALMVAFVGKAGEALRGANMFQGFLNMTRKASAVMEKNRAFKFLEFMAPPPCWNNPKVAGEGFKSYFRWVRKNTINPSGKGLGGGRYISDLKGVAQTVGIGLCVFGIALDAYKWANSDDWKGGRERSYDMVKTYVSLALGVATLVAMFCIPIVGQIAAIATLVWMALTAVGDLLGDYNKRWKEAYKNSYWYLSQYDPAFRTFYENRGQLKGEEKALSLLLAERDYGAVMRNPAPTTEADKKVQANSKAVFIALEKQGVLMTYYAQTGFTLPDFDINRLQQLWQKKADFMSWKPTEPEADKAKTRGFWGSLGHAINPKTWISWAGDKIQSRGFDKELKNKDVKPVFFNPDYVLVKKYKNYLMANDLKGGVYDTVGIRIEQSPFNYIPLVGIDSAAWNQKLMEQAFNADAFQVGVKEMMYFREQIKAANEAVKKTIKDNDKVIEKIVEDDLPHTKKMREALAALLDAYNSDPDREQNGLMTQMKKAFNWRWNDNNGKPTPRNIIQLYRPDIEQTLNYVPLSIAQKAAEALLMLINIKNGIDTAKLMQAMGQDKREIMENFESEFTNSAFNKYLKEGTFLDVKGSTFTDWLGEVYPAYSELEKFTNLYMQEVDKYSGAADTANSTTRERWYWFDKDVAHPKEVLRQLNDELRALKELTESFEDVKDTLNIRMPIADNSAFKNGVFKDGGYTLDWDTSDPININTMLDRDISNPILAPNAPDAAPE